MAEGTEEEQPIAESSKDDIVSFRVVYKKEIINISFSLDDTVGKLKRHIQDKTSVPPAMMKLMHKGLMKDDKTLRECKVTEGCKMMLVGSTLSDVLTVQPPSPGSEKISKRLDAPKKELWCDQKEHKKVIERGIPEDAMPGEKSTQKSLPSGAHLSGMLNKHLDKVRLTFKMEADEVWIQTRERTLKVPMTSIRSVTSEPILGHEEYHIVVLQMGSTEGSKYWLYWMPAQYVNAIKDIILGKWQL